MRKCWRNFAVASSVWGPETGFVQPTKALAPVSRKACAVVLECRPSQLIATTVAWLKLPCRGDSAAQRVLVRVARFVREEAHVLSARALSGRGVHLGPNAGVGAQQDQVVAERRECAIKHLLAAADRLGLTAGLALDVGDRRRVDHDVGAAGSVDGDVQTEGNAHRRGAFAAGVHSGRAQVSAAEKDDRPAVGLDRQILRTLEVAAVSYK